MAAHLDCDTCIRLWAEYSRGVMDELRGSTESNRPVRDAGAARQQEALEKIGKHVAEAHQKLAKSQVA